MPTRRDRRRRHHPVAGMAELRELLANRDEATLRRVRLAVAELLGAWSARARKRPRARRGSRSWGCAARASRRSADAGRGPRLSFVELTREIEKLAGCSISESSGSTAPTPTAATSAARSRRPSKPTARWSSPPPAARLRPASFNLLLRHCASVWLKAAPEEHMGRVLAQGDLRPMAASREAMEDLRGDPRRPGGLLPKADTAIDTSAQPLAESFQIRARRSPSDRPPASLRLKS